MCPKKYKITMCNAKYGHHGDGKDIHVNHKLHGFGTTNEKLESQENDNSPIFREEVKINGN